MGDGVYLGPVLKEPLDLVEAVVPCRDAEHGNPFTVEGGRNHACVQEELADVGLVLGDVVGEHIAREWDAQGQEPLQGGELPLFHLEELIVVRNILDEAVYVFEAAEEGLPVHLYLLVAFLIQTARVDEGHRLLAEEQAQE